MYVYEFMNCLFVCEYLLYIYNSILSKELNNLKGFMRIYQKENKKVQLRIQKVKE